MYTTGETPIEISEGNQQGQLIPSLPNLIGNYVTLSVTLGERNSPIGGLSGQSLFVSLDNGKSWRVMAGASREFRYQYLGEPVLIKLASIGVWVWADIL